jgi:hypothetical protein
MPGLAYGLSSMLRAFIDAREASPMTSMRAVSSMLALSSMADVI